MIYKNIQEMIGNTPLLNIDLRQSKWNLIVKMEKFNPGQSMKDRMALNMINRAEENGLLKKNGCIIESSSGNTGIGLAMISAERGYKFIAVVDHHAAKDKVAIMKAYGAEIVCVGEMYDEGEVAVKEREAHAKKLNWEIKDSFYCNQADNSANAEGYLKTLGREIMVDLESDIDVLIGSIGTGGSLCGTARYLKKKLPNLYIVGVEPNGSVIFGGEECPYFQSGAGNPGNVEIAENVDYSLIDMGVKASDKEAFNTVRFLAKRKGILLGGTSGGVIFKALEFLKKRQDKGTIIAVAADGGEKYLDTVFNDEWMGKRGLIDANVNEKLESWIKI